MAIVAIECEQETVLKAFEWYRNLKGRGLDVLNWTCICRKVGWLVAWLSGRTSVSDRRTFAVLRLTTLCG